MNLSEKYPMLLYDFKYNLSISAVSIATYIHYSISHALIQDVVPTW